MSPPVTNHPTQHRAPVFESTTRSEDLHQLHPAGNNVFALWQVFVENVDPVFKILHVPTTQRQILKASQDPTQIPSAFESLMFAIYYAAITSTQSSTYLETLFQEERQPLLDRYRHGVERSLEKANFMSTPDVTTLQALTIFLTCARQTLDKTYIWSMTGLLIRLAMKLGLHRDPVFLGVPSFWAEMRRRLWWCIATLDVRTAEENDMDPFICEHMFDTRFPANVNDADLHLNMTEPAPNLRRHTEMLYSLIRFEGSYAARKLVFSPKFTADNQYPSLSLSEKNDFIESLLKDFDHRYLRYCDNRIPICLLTVTSIRIVLAKVKLTINHPACNNAVPLSNAQLRDLTQSSVEIIEYARTLRTNDNYSRWIWLFQKYIEWDAVAFLLHSLTTSPLPDLLDRAWRAVDTFFDTWEDRVPEGDRRWPRLKSLRAKALSKQSPRAASSSSLGHPAVPVATRSGQIESDIDSRISRPSRPAEPRPFFTTDHQEYSQLPPEPLGQAFDPAPGTDFSEWNFDNVPYSMHGSLSWDIEIDETMFNAQL
ncbi:Fungal specific transcription factor domain-containing protein [Cladophialophora immunda]|nr:Fungal specific transcription factor domain-containing protein [Cladophialophora immunda]